MFLNLNDVLSADTAAQLCARLAAGDAGGFNAGEAIVGALAAHPLFVLGAQPRHFSRVVFRGLDAAVEPRSVVAEPVVDGVRADLCVVMSLSDASSYEGGEVTVDIGYGPERHRLPAGACIVYPASARRGDEQVTRGKRWSAEISVQSLIKMPVQREVLYDVGCSLHWLELFAGADTADVERLRKSQKNLLRLWSET